MSGYVVVIERDEAGGHSAWSPDLPGCIAAAANYDDCVQLMREAVAFHLDGMRHDGRPLPQPTAVASLIFPATPAA